MGMDLKLLVVDGASESWGFSHTILSVSRDYDLFRKIIGDFERRTFNLSIYVATVPDGSMEGESYYGHVKDTPYGEPITYIEIEKLAKTMSKCTDLSQNNKAILAYLKDCPYDLVALYWS